jgi:Transposase DDE domain
VDRGRRGSKHHLIACGAGNPLAVTTTAANVNDVTQTIGLVDSIPPVRGKRGRPRRRPRRLFGDGAYHSRRDRLALRARGSSRISPLVFESRLPVGSSAKRIVGRLTRARAIATRCCSPPDSSAGRCVRRA